MAFATPKNRQLLFDVAMSRFPGRVDAAMFGRFFHDFCDSEPFQDHTGAIPLMDMNKRFINQMLTHLNTQINQISTPVDFSRQAMGLDLPYQNPGKHPGHEDVAARRINDFAKSMAPLAPERPRQLEPVKPPAAMDPTEFYNEVKRRTLTIGQPSRAADATINNAVIDLDTTDMMSLVQNLLDEPVSPKVGFYEPPQKQVSPLDSRAPSAAFSQQSVQQNEIQVMRDALEMRMERIERTLAAIYAAIMQRDASLGQSGASLVQTAVQLAAGQVLDK